MLTKNTLLTATALGPETLTWSLLKPGPPTSLPGSKNSELFVEVPLMVTGVEAHLSGIAASEGVAGGGSVVA